MYVIEKCEQVERIDKAGSYLISNDPTGHEWPGLVPAEQARHMIDSDPSLLPLGLIDCIKNNFFGIKRIVFRPAHFNDGRLTSLEFNYNPRTIDISKRIDDDGYFDYDGHITEIIARRESDSGFEIFLADKGSPTINDNRLGFTNNTPDLVSPSPRNGGLRVHTFGSFGYGTSGIGYLKRMAGEIEVSGDNPGELVSTARQYIDDFIKKQEYPVWLVLKQWSTYGPAS